MHSKASFKLTIRLKSILFFWGLILTHSVYSQIYFNGNFEKLDPYGNPQGWDLTFNHANKFDVTVDSIVKRQGKFSIQISSKGNVPFGAISFAIPQKIHAKYITLIGSIKTDRVTNGYAGLWVRIDGDDNKLLAFENMDKNGVIGTSDWKEYMIRVPYDEDRAKSINLGALLAGKGRMWVDSLRLYADQAPIAQATQLKESFRALSDTAFSKGTGVKLIKLNKRTINDLNLLGQLWGFLKYHHPAIRAGKYNWDNELFRILPEVIECKGKKQLSVIFERWVDNLNKTDTQSVGHIFKNSNDGKIKPHYGNLFIKNSLNPTLVYKLKYLLSTNNKSQSYYVRDNDYVYPSYPIFEHEDSYGEQSYKDVGYRLLALYRYWNIIQYFYPNRNLTPEKWDNVLPKFIPVMFKVNDSVSYTNAILKLIAGVADTHAGIFNNEIIEKKRGIYRLPVRAEFLKNNLVVTNYYKDTLDVKKNFKIGDIILSINGFMVRSLIKKNLSVQTGSNLSAKLRDLPGNYLLRCNNSKFKIMLKRNGKNLLITSRGMDYSKIDFYDSDWRPKADSPGYRLINKDIGYVFPARYTKVDFEGLKKLFAGTKGVIIDYRCYPLDATAMNSLSNYFHNDSVAFAKYTFVSTKYPGLFTYTSPIQAKGNSKDFYKGKIIIIVNEWTQSSAEFNVMSFQSSPNAIVIGSKTAGADGSVTEITLPGKISTGISNIGIYYPDGTPTQRIGLRINYHIRPTISGIKKGQDELLDMAKALINH